MTTSEAIAANSRAIHARLMGRPPGAVNIAIEAKRAVIMEARRIAAAKEDERRKALAARESLRDWARHQDEQATNDFRANSNGGFSGAIPAHPTPARRLIREIEADVLALYPGVTSEMIWTRTYKRRIANIRFHVWWMIRQERPDISCARIGQIYGGYDHTSVMHGVAKVQRAFDACWEAAASIGEGGE